MYILIAATIFSKYPQETRLRLRKKDIMTQSQNTKSTFPHLSWQECELHFDNMLAVFLLMLMTPSIAIFSSDMAIGRYVAQRAGIGINAGRIRGINS